MMELAQTHPFYTFLCVLAAMFTLGAVIDAFLKTVQLLAGMWKQICVKRLEVRLLAEDNKAHELALAGRRQRVMERLLEAEPEE